MANEYSVAVGIDGSPSIAGAREFKRSIADIIASSKKLDTATAKNSKSLVALGASAAKTGSATGAEFRKAAQSVSNSSDRIAASTAKASSALVAFQNNTASASAQVKKMYQGFSTGSATAAVGMQRNLAASSRSFTDFGSVVTSVKGLLAGFAVAFSLQTAIKQITEFDTAMGRLKGLLGTGGSLDDFNKLRDAARELGATTIYSAGEAAQGLTELVKAGLNANQAITASAAVLNLAAAEQMELGRAASITAVTLSQFKLAADQAGRVTDVLAKVSVSAQTDVEGLSQGMKYVGVIANQLGIPLEEAAAALGVLSDAGMKGEQAGTNLRSALLALLTPSKLQRAALEELGTSAEGVKKTLGEEGLGGLVNQLREKFDKVTNPVEKAALAARIFGTEGATAALSLIGLNDRLGEYTKKAEESAGTTQKMADAMNDTLGGAFKELLSGLEELALQLGDAGLKEWLRSAADSVAALARGFGGMAEDVTKTSTTMQSWNKVGLALRDNIGLIKNGLLLLVAVFVGRWVGALTASIALQLRNTASMVSATYAMVAQRAASMGAATAMTAMTVAGQGLRAVMATLGGPVGLIMLGVSALAIWATTSDTATVSTDDLSSSLDNLSSKYAKATAAQRAFLVQDARVKQDEAIENANKLRKQLADSEAAKKEYAKIQSAAPVTGTGYLAGVDINAGRSAQVGGKIMADTEVVETTAKLEELTTAISQSQNRLATLTSLSAQAGTAVAAAGGAAEDAAGKIGGGDGGDSKSLAANARKASAEFDKFKSSLQSVMGDVNALAEAERKYKENRDALSKALTMSDAELEKLGYTHAQVQVAVDNLNVAWEKQRVTLDPIAKKYSDLKDAMKDASKQVNPMGAAQEELNKQLERGNELLKLTDEQLKDIGFTREGVTKGMRDLSAAAVENGTKLAKNAAEADPWAKAWENALGRVDEIFVDLWKSAFDGFKGFKDKFIDGIKSILAELANAATTRAFTAMISNWLGGSTTGSATGGLIQAGVGVLGAASSSMQVSNGAGGTIFSGQTGASAAGGAGGGSGGVSSMIYTQAGKYIAKGFAQYGVAGAEALGAASPYLAGAAAVAGGYYGFTQRGESNGDLGSLGATASYAALGYTAATVGIGAVAGASAGAAVGAAGAGAAAGATGAAMAIPVVGWVLAVLALVDLASGGKLFGTRYSPTAGATSIGISAAGGDATATRTDKRQKALFGGAKYRTVDVAASAEAEQAADDLYKSISNVMTEAANTLKVEVPPVIDAAVNVIYDIKKGKIKSTKYQVTTNGGKAVDVADQEEAMRTIAAEALFAVIKVAFPKADTIRAAWAPGLESLEQGVQTFMGLLASISADPAADAQKAFENSQLSGLQVYEKSKDAYVTLLGTFDGSIASMQKMTEATNALKKSQYDLLLQYMQLKEYTTSMFGGTAQNIRESLMDPDALYALRRTQISELSGQLTTETDPAKLQAIADEINRLTVDAYNMLDPDQQAVMAPEFLAFLDAATAAVNAQADIGLDGLKADTAETIDIAFGKLNDYADRQMVAVETFSQAVDRFAAGSGANTRSNTSGELN